MGFVVGRAGVAVGAGLSYILGMLLGKKFGKGEKSSRNWGLAAAGLSAGGAMLNNKKETGELLPGAEAIAAWRASRPTVVITPSGATSGPVAISAAAAAAPPGFTDTTPPLASITAETVSGATGLQLLSSLYYADRSGTLTQRSLIRGEMQRRGLSVGSQLTESGYAILRMQLVEPPASVSERYVVDRLTGSSPPPDTYFAEIAAKGGLLYRPQPNVWVRVLLP